MYVCVYIYIYAHILYVYIYIYIEREVEIEIEIDRYVLPHLIKATRSCCEPAVDVLNFLRARS